MYQFNTFLYLKENDGWVQQKQNTGQCFGSKATDRRLVLFEIICKWGFLGKATHRKSKLSLHVNP